MKNTDANANAEVISPEVGKENRKDTILIERVVVYMLVLAVEHGIVV